MRSRELQGAVIVAGARIPGSSFQVEGSTAENDAFLVDQSRLNRVTNQSRHVVDVEALH
jgi:hypothetical protein